MSGTQLRASDLRLKPNNITHQLALVPLCIGHLACPVDHLHALHPFIYGQLDFASPVVQMCDETCHDLFHSGRGLGAHSINHMLGEVWIKPILIARHFEPTCCSTGMLRFRLLFVALLNRLQVLDCVVNDSNMLTVSSCAWGCPKLYTPRCSKLNNGRTMFGQTSIAGQYITDNPAFSQRLTLPALSAVPASAAATLVRA